MTPVARTAARRHVPDFRRCATEQACLNVEISRPGSGTRVSWTFGHKTWSEAPASQSLAFFQQQADNTRCCRLCVLSPDKIVRIHVQMWLSGILSHHIMTVAECANVVSRSTGTVVVKSVRKRASQSNPRV